MKTQIKFGNILTKESVKALLPVISECHRKGQERDAAFGLMGGFVIMMVLDTIFG